jgi:hypothetical protein
MAHVAGVHQLEAFTDASPIALAYYFPSLKLAYYAERPPNPPTNTIFWLEALAVCSVINHATDVWGHDFTPKLDRLLVHTDNMNTVNMFHSLHAQPPYNPLLIYSIDARSRSSLDVRTSHVPGELNIIADTISRMNFALARRLIPGLTILPFQPPRDALGVTQK